MGERRVKTLKELREELKAQGVKVKGLEDRLREVTNPTTDQLKELDAEIVKYDGIEAEKERAEKLEVIRKNDERLSASRGRQSGRASAEEQHELDDEHEGRESQRADRRSLAEKFAASDGWQQYKTDGYPGGRNTGKVEVDSFYHRRRWDEGPEESYTIVATGAFPTASGSPSLIAPVRVPGIFTQDLPETNVRSALQNFQTNSPVIQFFRQLVWTRAAAFVAEATATGGSSGLKPEGGVTFESAQVVAEILAAWMPVTNNTLQDEPQMRGIIEGLLMDDIRLAEDDALINGDGTGSNILGLTNVSGVQVIDDTYFGLHPVENDGNAWEDFDRITRARTEIRLVGRASATALLISPADLERLLTITDNNGQYYSGSPFSDLAISRMRGLAVIETEALDEGEAIVLDGRKFAVFDRMQAAVTAGWINDDFVRNKIAILAEERIAFAPFRPAAAAIVTLTSAA
jgi:HK97 family phage major capsid protein